MSDTSQDEWTADATPPPKKKGLPSWLLFCGGGCLVAVVIAAVLIFMAVDTIKDAANPEAQWTELEKVIEVDARPNEMTMVGGLGVFGTEFWTMMHNSGYMVMVMRNPEASQEERNEIFGGDVSSAGIPGLSEIKNRKVGEVMIQGRAVQVARFETKNPGQSQQGCFVDLTAEGDTGFLLFYIVSDGRSNGEETISDEQLNEMLQAFVIGPERTVYVPNGPHPQAGQTSLSESQFKSQRIQPELKLDTSVEEAPQEDE